MHFHFSFYSSLLLIFFTHGILFTFLLLKRGLGQERTADLWLAGFTLVCTLNIAPWMLGHAGWYSVQPYRNLLFYLPLQHFFLLGPLLFFYTRSLLNPGARFGRRHLLHFLPGALYIAYTAFMFLADEVFLSRPFFYADGHDRDLDSWYRIAGILSVSVYLFLSLCYYSWYRKLAFQMLSRADTVLFSWIRRFLIALLLMQLLDLLFFCLFPGWGSFTSKWWYYFFFSLLFYYVAFSAYTNTVRPLFAFRLLPGKDYFPLLQGPDRGLFFRPLWLPEAGAEELIEPYQPQQQNVPADQSAGELLKAITHALTVEKMYEDPELSLPVLARHLRVNTSVLSRVINQGFQLNFNDLVNSRRVAAVKDKLMAGEHLNQTLLGIALDCGFNSKTTFNRVFRKQTGLSPKDFVRKMAATPGGPAEKEVPDHNMGRPAGGDLSPSL